MKHTTLRNIRRREKMKRAIMPLIPCLICLLFIGFLSVKCERLEQENFQLSEAMFEKDSEIKILELTVNSLRNVVNELNEQITDVSEVNRTYVDELNTFRKREELYDKYEYAIMAANKRTDLTYEEVQYGEELMASKGLNPHLMFGSIMVESTGRVAALNQSSGATGYGQFLDSTASWIWKDMLGNKTYHSDIRKDGKSNILMMATYYDYLYPIVGNTFKVVKCYSGNSTDEGTASYIKRINDYTSTVGVIIE
jgi:hypothetical protein